MIHLGPRQGGPNALGIHWRSRLIWPSVWPARTNVSSGDEEPAEWQCGAPTGPHSSGKMILAGLGLGAGGQAGMHMCTVETVRSAHSP